MVRRAMAQAITTALFTGAEPYLRQVRERQDAPAAASSTGPGRRCVAVYRSLPTEPPTDDLIAALTSAGIPLIEPHLMADKDLSWHRLGTTGQPIEPLLPPEAIGDALVIVTPALSVDVNGTRLGQGGGSYDRALARAASEACIVAIVFDTEWTSDALPAEAHDHRVHAVITPGRGWRSLPQPPVEPPN